MVYNETDLKQYTLQLLGIQGNIVFEKRNIKEIQISDLKQGLYLHLLIDNEGINHSK